MEKIRFRERFSRFWQKTIPLPAFLLTVLVFLGLFIGMANRVDQISSSGSINGLYQSRFSPAKDAVYYNAQFFHGEFKIERLVWSGEEGQKQKTLLEGTYQNAEENLYLLRSNSSASNTIAVMGHDSFYFYDTETNTAVRFFRH